MFYSFLAGSLGAGGGSVGAARSGHRDIAAAPGDAAALEVSPSVIPTPSHLLPWGWGEVPQANVPSSLISTDSDAEIQV